MSRLTRLCPTIYVPNFTLSVICAVYVPVVNLCNPFYVPSPFMSQCTPICFDPFMSQARLCPNVILLL